MSTVVLPVPAAARDVRGDARSIDAVLLGLGTIGTAVARLAGHRAPAAPPRVRISGALVRDVSRQRRATLPDGALLTSDARELLARRPDVVIELLGGVDPALSLVRSALLHRIPVVTANKSLLAAHGDELLELARSTGTPLRYEAAVLAGVPFLGAAGQRAHAAGVTRLCGILNGTSNFILTRMRDERVDAAAALAETQNLGLAEPDPRNDITGIDAAEKLAVLLRHYGCASVQPAALERTGIEALRSDDIEHAEAFDGAIKAIAVAAQAGGGLHAFVGPAFVPATHRLARIDGAENGLVLENAYGTLLFSGPGAGPEPTAATVLDDVLEIGAGGTRVHSSAERPPQLTPVAPTTEWFIRISGAPRLPAAVDLTDLLGAYGVWPQRWSTVDSRSGRAVRWLLTLGAARERVEHALHALSAASGCETNAIRALGAE